MARTLVDRLAEGPAADGAEFDFVAEVAAPLPLTVICNLMGVPDSEAERVFRCSNVILGAGDPEYVPEGGDLGPVLLAAGAELAELVSGLCRLRRESPTGDLVTALADAEVDGERLTDAEIASFFVLLSVAGNETTRNALSHALVGLTDQPGSARPLAQRLRGAGAGRRRGDRALVEPGDLDAPHRAQPTPPNSAASSCTRATGCCCTTRRATATRPSSTTRSASTCAARPTRISASAARGRTTASAPTSRAARSPCCIASCCNAFPAVRATGEPARLASSFVNGIKHLPASLRD